MKLFMRIQDAFDIPGRARVVVGRHEDQSARLLAGDEFILVLRSGEQHEIKAIEVNTFTGKPHQLGIAIEDHSLSINEFVGSEILVAD